MPSYYATSGGKTVFDTDYAIFDLLEKTAKGFATDLAENTAKRIRYNVYKDIYMDYDPSIYHRTNELLNTVVEEKTKRDGVKKFSSKVVLKASMFKTYIKPTPKLWGTHTSESGGHAGDAIIRGFEEYGFQRKYGKNRIYKREPVHMVEKAEQEINDILPWNDSYYLDINRTLKSLTFKIGKMGD